MSATAIMIWIIGFWFTSAFVKISKGQPDTMGFAFLCFMFWPMVLGEEIARRISK